MIAAVQGHHQTASYQNRDEASRTASPPERSPDYIDHAFACVNRSPIVGQAGRVESISYHNFIRTLGSYFESLRFAIGAVSKRVGVL